MPRWVKLADMEQLRSQSSVEVAHDGRIYALFWVDGQVHAIDGMCPHQGGPLAEGERDAHTVTCPWHGWRFDLRDGRCLTARAVSQRVFDVRIDGTDVLVDVP
jgi:nitrite reductase/ring-hydroxylating ferredoxin subunit